MHAEIMDRLRRAAAAYDYPAVTYDFGQDCERRHRSMSSVEAEIRGALLSPNIDEVRNGLSNVLYWGFYRSPGRRAHYLRQFQEEIKEHQLQAAGRLFHRLTGPGLRPIKDLGLPVFSQVSFLSKVRMFLDPTNYAVLDSKIAGVLTDPRIPLGLKVYPTAIPDTADNERAYARWCRLCRLLAQSALPAPARAVDVERAIFHLAEHGKHDLCVALLQAELTASSTL
ncbi:MAG TPA: hypothetical protein VD969_09435 [Symbiobacteriaceae bacterium]|nr:hypothetical protein [Symbiobacteriaceae bacterium]